MKGVDMRKVKELKKNNEGFGVIEVVLIIIVVIALVLLFQDEIRDFMENALDKLQPAADKILIDTGLDV